MGLTGVIWMVGVIGWMIIGGWPFHGRPAYLPAKVSRAATSASSAGSRSRSVSR